MQETKRIGWLDVLKGFAAITVVMGHIADGYIKATLFPDNAGFEVALYNIIYSFHMPLFFVLSGVSFGIAYLEGEKDYKLKTTRINLQVKNIVILYFAWCVILWLFKMVFSNDVNSGVTLSNLLWLPLKAINPYWYLYVLALCYLITCLLISKHVNQKHVLIISTALCLAQYWIAKSWAGQFTATAIVAYYLFFFIGLLISKRKDFDEWIGKPPVIVLNFAIGIFIGLAFSYRQGEEIGWSQIPVLGSVMALALSLAFIGLAQKFSIVVFELLGRYSLEIYLIHCFITAGNRKILPMLGITTFGASFVVNLLMAVTIPVLFSMLLKKIGLYVLMFKPATYFAKLKEKSKA